MLRVLVCCRFNYCFAGKDPHMFPPLLEAARTRQHGLHLLAHSLTYALHSRPPRGMVAAGRLLLLCKGRGRPGATVERRRPAVRGGGLKLGSCICGGGRRMLQGSAGTRH